MVWTGTPGSGALGLDGDVTPNSDNAYDLGTSGARWQDIYLAGNLYLGGTGAANALDDYEEGSFTPGIEGDSTAGTPTYTTQFGRYTKVGDLCTAWGEVVIGAKGGMAGGIRLTGLPFTSANIASLWGGAIFTRMSDITWAAGDQQMMGTVRNNNTRIELYFIQSGAGDAAVQDGDLGATTRIAFVAIYKTA